MCQRADLNVLGENSAEFRIICNVLVYHCGDYLSQYNYFAEEDESEWNEMEAALSRMPNSSTDFWSTPDNPQVQGGYCIARNCTFSGAAPLSANYSCFAATALIR